MSARHVIVRGCVQGVGFRAWARERGQAHGLAGWVRNRRDGSVELIAAGAEAALEAFVGELSRGPRLARVDAVDWRPVVSIEDGGGAPGFEIRPTA